MNKQTKIEKEISKTLENFEKTEHLPPNPYFYAQVMARLEEKHKKQNAFSLLLKPALLAALLLINVFTMLWYYNSSSVHQSSARQKLLEVLSTDLKIESRQNNLLFNQ